MRVGCVLVAVFGLGAAVSAMAEPAGLALACEARESVAERRLCDRSNGGDLAAAIGLAELLDAERDGATLVRLYRHVAAAGDPRGLFGLAQMHRDGGTLPPDQRTALRLLHAAAELGLVEAERELAQIYRRGQEVDIDLPEAEHWHARAIAYRDVAKP